MCYIDWSDGYSELLRNSQPTARKEHKCSECGRIISKGERYTFEVTLFDKQIWQYKFCSHCILIRKWLEKQCGGWMYDAILEDFHEHQYESPSYKILKAIAIVKRKWKYKGNLVSTEYLSKLLDVSLS